MDQLCSAEVIFTIECQATLPNLSKVSLTRAIIKAILSYDNNGLHEKSN